jgi:hypothetical protein
MSTGNLTPVHLLPTIDQRLAHKTELIAEIAKFLHYHSAEEWIEVGIQASHQQLAPLLLIPKLSAPPQLFAASHFSIVSYGQLQTSTTQPRCLLMLNITYATKRAIPLGTTSRLPVHNQAWAFANGLTKPDEIFYNYVKYKPTKVANKMALPRLIAHRLRQALSKLTHKQGRAKHVERAGKLWEAHSAQMMRVIATLREAIQSQHPMQLGPQPPSDYALKIEADQPPPVSPGDEAAGALLRAKATNRQPSALEIPIYGSYPEMQTAVLAIELQQAIEAAAAQAAAAQATVAQAAAEQAVAAQKAQVPPAQPIASTQPHTSATTLPAKRSRDNADKSDGQIPAKKTKSTSASSGVSRAKTDAPKAGKTETVAQSTSVLPDKANKQAKKKGTTDKNCTAGAKDKAKKPRVKKTTSLPEWLSLSCHWKQLMSSFPSNRFTNHFDRSCNATFTHSLTHPHASLL